MRNNVVLFYLPENQWELLLPFTEAAVFCIPLMQHDWVMHRETFDKFLPNLQDRDAVYAVLKNPSDEAHVIFNKINIYSQIADMAFVGADYLNYATGHEIIRSVAAQKKPVWGVGTNMSNSPLAPMYLDGILYPKEKPALLKTYWREVPRG